MNEGTKPLFDFDKDELEGLLTWHRTRYADMLQALDGYDRHVRQLSSEIQDLKKMLDNLQKQMKKGK